MIQVVPTSEWQAAHRDALIGILEVSRLDNSLPSIDLDRRKREVEARLRERFSGYSRADFLSAPVLAEYARYYKAFDKTYHVLLQIESIVLKHKSLPSVSPLVDANFVAEVETLVLTAGHDVAKLCAPVCIDVSRAGDCITQMNGSTRPMRTGDMVMRDAYGVCCSVIYGQDNRSPISTQTTHALYVSYAPPGVSSDIVEAQLQTILEYIRTFARACTVEQRSLIQAAA